MHTIQEEFKLKKFLIFSFPITLQVLLRNIVGLTDNFMVGVLGPDYMAALRISTSYFFFFIVLLFAFSNAGSIIAGQLWGRGDKKEFYNVCGVTLFISTIISLIFGLIMFFGSRVSAAIIIDDAKIIQYSAEYMRVIAICFVFTGISIGMSVIFTSQGDTKIPFYQQVITTVLNVIFNYLLIFGKFGFPKIGVSGAAWSSLISTLAGLLYMYIVAVRTGRLPSLQSIVRPAMSNIKEILHIGLPVLGDMFFWQFAMMVYLKFIGMAGKEAVAIYGVIGLFFSVLYLTVSGFVTGTGVCVSQIIGARKSDMAMKFGYKALWFSMLFGAVAGVLIILFSPLIPGIFKLEAQSVRFCIITIIILGLRQPFATANGVLPAAIRSGKDTKFPFFTSFIAFVLIGLPLTFLAGPVFQLGIVGIFTAMTIEEISKSIIFFYRFRSGKWIKGKTNSTMQADTEEMVRSNLLDENS